MAVSTTKTLEISQTKVEMLFSIALKDGSHFEAYNVVKGEATSNKTMQIRKELGITSPKYQVIIPVLIEHVDEQKKVRGKWGYVDGVCTDKNGLYVPDKTGELIELGNKKIDPEQVVHVWSGYRPLSLYVNADLYDDRRFNLDGYDGPGYAASVVFGIRAAAPEIANVLRVENKNQTVVLRSREGAEIERISVAEGTTVNLE
jgi:hypothetical protein